MAISASTEELADSFQDFAARRGFDDIVVTLGLQPHAADGTSIAFSLPLREPVAQASGMFSAAALFGAADIAGTFLAMQSYDDQGLFPLAVQSSQNFLSNSKAEFAVATARMLRAGGSVAVTEVAVADSAGKLLMSATFTYVLSRRVVGR